MRKYFFPSSEWGTESSPTHWCFRILGHGGVERSDHQRRVSRWARVLALFLAFCPSVGALEDLSEASPDGPEHVVVYLTLGEALQKAFDESDSIWAETWHASRDEVRALERQLGWRVTDSTFTVHRATREGRPAGYAIVGNEVGLYKPITFLVKIGEDRHVESAHVMIYRESRGGEVRRRRFLQQYRDKEMKSPIRINRDIIGVTGATLSVRALNAGVKKALAVVEAAYPRE